MIGTSQLRVKQGNCLVPNARTHWWSSSLPVRLPNRKRLVQEARVLSESSDMALGTPAPDFELLETTSGKMLRLSDYCKVTVLCHDGVMRHDKASSACNGQLDMRKQAIITHPAR